MRMTVEGECWIWTGYRNEAGYGRIAFGDGKQYVHRLMYQIFHGPILEGLTIDHLCRNPACVNPAHLEAVTMRENVLRGDGPTAQRARSTHCVEGHAFDAKNTYWTPRGYRDCRKCRARRERDRQRRKRALQSSDSTT